MTTTTYRRTRHSASLLHAHLVFVTKYRQKVFTDDMPTFCQHTTAEVCADLGAEPVEFNGEANHMHLHASYPATLAISTLAQRMKSEACAQESGHARRP